MATDTRGLGILFWHLHYFYISPWTDRGKWVKICLWGTRIYPTPFHYELWIFWLVLMDVRTTFVFFLFWVEFVSIFWDLCIDNNYLYSKLYYFCHLHLQLAPSWWQRYCVEQDVTVVFTQCKNSCKAWKIVIVSGDNETLVVMRSVQSRVGTHGHSPPAVPSPIFASSITISKHNHLSSFILSQTIIETSVFLFKPS